MPSSKDAFKYRHTEYSPDENFKSNARQLDANLMPLMLLLAIQRDTGNENSDTHKLTKGKTRARL